jgi:DHA2 family methylenomycin A resistance protein-like MFS transporter
MECEFTEFTQMGRTPSLLALPLPKELHMPVPPTRQFRLVQAAACLGFVVVLLDVSVVNVALEALSFSFATTMTGLQWVINGYALAFAALLLTAGALGDRLGAKRVFMAGFAIFTLASLICGVASNLGILIAARILQGLGAALLVPTSLSLLQQVFPDAEARSRAVGWWGAAGGIALAAGPVAGGLLISAIGWRSIFLVNLPIGLLGLWLTYCYAPASPRQADRSLDLSGQITAALALGSLTAALTEASRLGWGHPLVLGGLLLFVLIGGLFLRLEARNPHAMLPLALFRNPTLSAATAIGLIVNFAFYGMVFIFSLYFQSVRHFSPLQTGLAFLPMMAMLMVMNIIAGRLITRIGARRLTVIGMSASALGYLLLLPVVADGAYGLLTVPMLLAGSGIALTIPTITNATLAAVLASRAGIASGVLNSARQVGGVLGVALFGFLVRHQQTAQFIEGMRLAILFAVAVLAIGAVLGFLGMRPASHSGAREGEGQTSADPASPGVPGSTL